MRQLRVTIPDGVEFADLRLSRDADDGQVRFKMGPIEAICEASALDLDEIVQGPEPLVGLLIAAWYAAHREQGGAPEPGAGGLHGRGPTRDGARRRFRVPAGTRLIPARRSGRPAA
jgi:hypothetical protein